MGLILILIGLILLIGYCLYRRLQLVAGLLILITVLCALTTASISTKYRGNSKGFIREYEVISALVDRGVSDSFTTRKVVWINKAILYERDLCDSKWTNWLGSKQIAELKLLE